MLGRLNALEAMMWAAMLVQQLAVFVKLAWRCSDVKIYTKTFEQTLQVHLQGLYLQQFQLGQWWVHWYWCCYWFIGESRLMTMEAWMKILRYIARRHLQAPLHTLWRIENRNQLWFMSIEQFMFCDDVKIRKYNACQDEGHGCYHWKSLCWMYKYKQSAMYSSNNNH